MPRFDVGVTGNIAFSSENQSHMHKIGKSFVIEVFSQLRLIQAHAGTYKLDLGNLEFLETRYKTIQLILNNFF